MSNKQTNSVLFRNLGTDLERRQQFDTNAAAQTSMYCRHLPSTYAITGFYVITLQIVVFFCSDFFWFSALKIIAKDVTCQLMLLFFKHFSFKLYFCIVGFFGIQHYTNYTQNLLVLKDHGIARKPVQ